MVVERAAGNEAVHGVRDQVLRSEAFLDVRQKPVGCLYQIRALAAARRRHVDRPRRLAERLPNRLETEPLRPQAPQLGITA